MGNRYKHIIGVVVDSLYWFLGYMIQLLGVLCPWRAARLGLAKVSIILDKHYKYCVPNNMMWLQR